MTEGSRDIRCVPFCLSKCSYCDFYSVESTGQMEVTAGRCVKNTASFIEMEGVSSRVFTGGGTPSLLSVAQFARIMAECYKRLIDVT